MVADSNKKSVNYAIVGGLGFLGQHLMHALLNQSDVKCSKVKIIDRVSSLSKCRQVYPADFTDDRVQFSLNIDISKEDDFADLFKDVDVVFLVAAAIAYGRKNKALLDQTNIKGVENIVRHAKQMSVQKLVYVSSFAILGCLDSKDKENLASETCERNLSKERYAYYGISKYHGERAALAAADDNFRVVVALPGVLLGPGPCHHASTLPFEIALNQKWTVAPQGGAGYIDVRDAADALVALLKDDEKNGKYLLVSSNLEHKELLQRIAMLANKELKVVVISRLFSPLIAAVFTVLEWILPAKVPYSKEGVTQTFRYRYFSSKKLMDKFNWLPKYSLDETLRDTINWLLPN